MEKIRKIYELCPTLDKLSSNDWFEAVIRMNIAHVMNGGEFIGFHETAIAYLQSMKG